MERIITKSFARLMGRGTHRGFITYEELSKSLGKRNLSDENLAQAFIHILDEKVTLVEKKSDFKALRKKESSTKDDPLSAILIGVDSPWEVCLLKLMVELVQESAQGNMQQMQKQVLKEKKQYLDRIDQAFAAASREPSRINDLASMLKKEGLWETYEDRFFALVRASQK